MFREPSTVNARFEDATIIRFLPHSSSSTLPQLRDLPKYAYDTNASSHARPAVIRVPMTGTG